MQRLTETLAALTDAFEADWQIALARWLIVSCFLLNGLFNCAPHRVTEHVQRLQQFGTPLALPIFWAGIDAARRNLARINVMNNCAILGGLLLLLQHTARD